MSMNWILDSLRKGFRTAKNFSALHLAFSVQYLKLSDVLDWSLCLLELNIVAFARYEFSFELNKQEVQSHCDILRQKDVGRVDRTYNKGFPLRPCRKSSSFHFLVGFPNFCFSSIISFWNIYILDWLKQCYIAEELWNIMSLNIDKTTMTFALFGLSWKFCWLCKIQRIPIRGPSYRWRSIIQNLAGRNEANNWEEKRIWF